jgi:hypothetical protein
MRRKRFQKGSLQSRKHGKHRMWVAFFYEDGERRCRTLGPCSQMSKSEAEAVLSSVLREINSGTSKTTKPIYTFKQFVEDVYLPFCRRSWKESTAGTSEQTISSHLIPEFGKNLLHAIRREDLQDFLDRKAEDFSASVVAHLRWFLNAIFKLAMSDGLTLNNPAAELRIPRKCQPGRAMRPLTEKEVEKYLGVFGLREKLIARLAIFEGMRPGEKAGARYPEEWQDSRGCDFRWNAQVVRRVVHAGARPKRRRLCIPIREGCYSPLLGQPMEAEHAAILGEGGVGMGSLSSAQEDKRQLIQKSWCRSESRLRSEGPRNRRQSGGVHDFGFGAEAGRNQYARSRRFQAARSRASNRKPGLME